jgi:hypothetical protein
MSYQYYCTLPLLLTLSLPRLCIVYIHSGKGYSEMVRFGLDFGSVYIIRKDIKIGSLTALPCCYRKKRGNTLVLTVQ